MLGLEAAVRATTSASSLSGIAKKPETQSRLSLWPGLLARVSQKRLVRLKCAFLKPSIALKAASDSEQTIKQLTGREKLVRIPKGMSDSSAVKNEAGVGKVPELEKSGKAASDAAPTSYMEPSVNIGTYVA